ncbi:MAG: glycosyltransferase family 4 protein [Burkholderiales bacterium]|nr:glycosyltransferase family 4 protein [Burkholderiales bacterium]
MITLDCIIFGLQRFGGISNYWSRLLETMRDEHPDYDLVLPKSIRYAGFDPARMSCHVHDARESLPASVSRYLAAQAAPDSVFHTSYYRRPSGKVRKYVVTAYDFIYERYRTGLPKWVHAWQKQASIRSADAVICISHSTKHDVLQFCPGVNPAQVHVVHLGVDFDLYFPDPGETPVNEAPLVLFVGQRTGYKRFDLAVEAVRQSASLVLGIVGPGLTTDERMLLGDRLGARWTEFGPVSSAQLRRLYSRSFAFLFPSDYEGFGLPVLEAMACGCPVVASAAASLPEVGGSAALYAAEQRPEFYAAALTSLLEPTYRCSIVDAGFSRCRDFSWARTCAQTLAIYGCLGHPADALSFSESMSSR